MSADNANVYDVGRERALFREKMTLNAHKRLAGRVARLCDDASALQKSVQTLLSGFAKSGSDEGKRKHGDLGIEELLASLRQLTTQVVEDYALARAEQRVGEARDLFKLDTSTNGLCDNDWRPSIIYADPPWQYTNPNHAVGTDTHYNNMSTVELMQMPVASLASDDCALLMWATLPKLDDALLLMSAWGFNYRTGFLVWVKIDRYLGRPSGYSGDYTRSNAEILLVGIRGNMRQSYNKKFSTPNVLLSRNQNHSRKPEVVRQIITDLFGDLPRIELFGRKNHATEWIVWGNEADGSQLSIKQNSNEPVNVCKKRNVMTGGAKSQLMARKALARMERIKKRKRPAGTGKLRGKLPMSLTTTTERLDAAVCFEKREHTLLTCITNCECQQHTAIEEQKTKRHQLISSLNNGTTDAYNLDNFLSSLELASIKPLSFNNTQGRDQVVENSARNGLYSTLTNRQLQQHLPKIYTEQRRNADRLFAFNRNKKCAKIKLSL